MPKRIPHISYLTKEHALMAAQKTGFPYSEVQGTEYGYTVTGEGCPLFSFYLIGPNAFSFYMDNRAIPNIIQIANFLILRYRW